MYHDGLDFGMESVSAKMPLTWNNCVIQRALTASPLESLIDHQVETLLSLMCQITDKLVGGLRRTDQYVCADIKGD